MRQLLFGLLWMMCWALGASDLPRRIPSAYTDASAVQPASASSHASACALRAELDECSSDSDDGGDDPSDDAPDEDPNDIGAGVGRMPSALLKAPEVLRSMPERALTRSLYSRLADAPEAPPPRG